MADNKRISDLQPQPVANYIASSGDLLAIVDVGGLQQTKRITKNYLMAYPGPIGLGTADQAEFSVLTLGGNPVNEFSTDETLSGNLDTAVPTEKAVKSYVDTAVSNAVKLNIIHTSLDSTAVIGDVILADTTGGDISVVLDPNKEGKIIVIKDSIDLNKVVITTLSGVIYNGGPVSSVEISIDYSVFEFLCDGVNFYVI